MGSQSALPASQVDMIGEGCALSNLTSPDQEAASTIVYSTVGRSQYAFDIYSVDLDGLSIPEFKDAPETLMTDGVSVNTNGAFDRCVAGQ